MPTCCCSAAIRCRRNPAFGRCSSTEPRFTPVNEMMAWFLCLALLQDPPKPAAAEAAPAKPEKKSVYVALVGGDVHTVTQGVVKGGTVLLKDDKIFKVGVAVDLPEGTTK